MGVSQNILKVIQSKIIKFPRLQSLRLFLVVADDLDRGRGAEKACENEGCELWGCRGGGVIYKQRWGWHGKGVSISDTSSLV